MAVTLETVLEQVEALSPEDRQKLLAILLEEAEEAEDTRLVDEIEARMAAGEERLYSHEEVWAEIEALERDGALPD